MARPRSPTPKPIRQLVQEQRDGLYARGYRNLNMAVSPEVIARLDRWKSRHQLRSRDEVVARVIRQCMATTPLDAFVLKAAPRSPDLRRISPIVPADVADYVKGVQGHFHSLAYGPVFEMIVAQIGSELVTPGVVALVGADIAFELAGIAA